LNPNPCPCNLEKTQEQPTPQVGSRNARTIPRHATKDQQEFSKIIGWSHERGGLTRVEVRFRGQFAYIDGHLPNGEILPLCRLRYGGSASSWGFALYRASHDDYQDNILPPGHHAGSPEDALDCACGLYLADPTAWTELTTDTPTN
jgi:hypothetical protein